MGKREDYQKLLSELKLSQNEDEVLDKMTKIIKSFTSQFYKNDLYENPYFKSLIPDIKEEIYSELIEIRNSLRKEVSAIEIEIIKLNNQGISNVFDLNITKLRNLKKECIILIKELDNRLDDLEFL